VRKREKSETMEKDETKCRAKRKKSGEEIKHESKVRYEERKETK